jgi:hypothetical protein
MKLKLTILSALFAAGVFASFALAEGGKHAKKADDNNCQGISISGTMAPQTLAITVDKASERSGIPAGTKLNLAVGAAGQTVRVKVEACLTGTSAGLQYGAYSVREVKLKVKATQTGTTTTGTTTTGTTTTGTTTTSTTKKHDDEHGNNDGDNHHKGGTTTTRR